MDQKGGQVREGIIRKRCREKNVWRKIRDCVLRRREDSDCERVIMVRDDTIGLGTFKGCVVGVAIGERAIGFGERQAQVRGKTRLRGRGERPMRVSENRGTLKD
jgi:hypothetical protein